MAKQKGGRSRAGGRSGGSSSGPGRIFYVVLGLVALGGVAFLLLADGGDEAGGLDQPLPAWASNVEADAGAGVAVGPEDAPVTVMEFADYQCPHCAQFAGFTGRLLRQNYVEERGLVRWVLYDYLVGFENTIPASIAARCAGDQGRYWPMHDLILGNQSEWAASGSPGRHFRDYAEELGLDEDAFAECLDERRHLEAVMASHQYGVEQGVRGTPTLFVNGERVDDIDYQALETRIREAAESAGGGSEAASGGG